MNILEGWNTYHFKGDILRHVSDSNHFQNNIRIIGSQDINITIQDIRFQDKSLSNIQNFLFHFDLLRYQLHDIVQKYLYTPDEAMYPTFQMKYVLAIQHVCSWRCYSNNLEDIFLGHPVCFKQISGACQELFKGVSKSFKCVSKKFIGFKIARMFQGVSTRF